MTSKNSSRNLQQLLNKLLIGLIIISPGIIAYYFCHDYKGRGNSPEMAPMAAVVTSFIWTPFYLGLKELFRKHSLHLNLFFLTIFLLIIYQVTISNPKF